MKSILIRLGVLVSLGVIVCAWYIIPDRFFVEYADVSIKEARENRVQETSIEDAEKSQEEGEEVREQKIQIERDQVKHAVPFTSQAPHAQWDDPRFQDACEEASILMAYAWVTDRENLSKNDAEEELVKIFAYEEIKFNGSIDTSAADTAMIFQEFYGHPAEVHENVTMEEIYDLLGQGMIVLAPTNGKMLGNPNFSHGGPDRHMLVIIGYDRNNREFITNDPGTRLGRGYKYKDSTLYNAIRDYSTGTKTSIVGAKKNVIVIKKDQ